MGLIKQILEDNNNKLLNMICDSIIRVDKNLKDELQPPQISRNISMISFGDEAAVRCFLRDRKYIILVVNGLNNNLLMYKGIIKGDDGIWEATNHYKTIHNLVTLDDTKVLEEVTKDINNILS